MFSIFRQVWQGEAGEAPTPDETSASISGLLLRDANLAMTSRRAPTSAASREKPRDSRVQQATPSRHAPSAQPPAPTSCGALATPHNSGDARRKRVLSEPLEGASAGDRGVAGGEEAGVETDLQRAMRLSRLSLQGDRKIFRQSTVIC